VKVILINGKIYVEKNKFCQGLLIENGIIRAIGSNEEMANLTGDKVDKVIDLQGKTVLPGFNDSHLHLSGIGAEMVNCNLKGTKSIDEIIQRGKEFLKANPQIKVLYGRGWNQDYFIYGEKRLLNRLDLDKISSEIPIIFERVCGHLAVGNTKAIEILGIDGTNTIDGGTIEVDAEGKPNGVFTESAISLLHTLIPPKSDEDREREFLKAMDYALSQGITSVQSCDIMDSKSEVVFKIIKDLFINKKLKIRYSHQFNYQRIEDFNNYLYTEFNSEGYDEKFLSKGGLKLFNDGSLGARTALLSEDYKDAPGIKGVEVLTEKELMDLVKLATENKIRVVTHAIGDGAIKRVINVYQKSIENWGNKDNELRHGIIHCQITTMEQLKRIANLKIPVMYQPIFLDYDRKIVENRVGKKLASTSYAFNTLHKLGGKISFGTDAPVEDCNPFRNLYFAVTRGGYNMEEKMELTTAIDAYTIGSAFNEGKENFKGRLNLGFVADLIVLNKDIFKVPEEEIKDIKVEMAMVNGEIVYQS
jgi:predicted amidohydrolase YtcJ